MMDLEEQVQQTQVVTNSNQFDSTQFVADDSQLDQGDQAKRYDTAVGSGVMAHDPGTS
jgi:hypothetical protein